MKTVLSCILVSLCLSANAFAWPGGSVSDYHWVVVDQDYTNIYDANSASLAVKADVVFDNSNVDRSLVYRAVWGWFDSQNVMVSSGQAFETTIDAFAIFNGNVISDFAPPANDALLDYSSYVCVIQIQWREWPVGSAWGNVAYRPFYFYYE